MVTVSRPKLCIIVTVDITLQNLCRGRLEYFIAQGFDVTVVCAPTTLAAAIEDRGVRLHTAPLVRAIAPVRDLRALWNLYRFLRRERFDLVEVSTPKAALIGSVAAWLARCPRIVHLLRGLAYEGQGGWQGGLLRWSHRVACRLPHRVISISRPLHEAACRDGICHPQKIIVLGLGSSNGVDLDLFAPQPEAVRLETRRRSSIPNDALVAGFVGRITGDKGVTELIDAFLPLSDELPDFFLLIVGDFEARDRPPERVFEAVRHHPRIRHVGWRQYLPPLYAAMDFVVLPSHREGFGTVLLEAAAMELPVVTTDVVGGIDAVVDGETGLCIPARDASRLSAAMNRLATDAPSRSSMGKAGRRHVRRHFDCKAVWALQEQEYRRLLATGG